MLKNKRKNRKQKRKLKLYAMIVMGVGVVLLLVAGGFYLYEMQKPLYVSPLSSIKAFTLLSQDDIGKRTLEKGLANNHIEYTTIKTSGSDLIVLLKNGSKVTFSSKKDIILQISSLQYILTRLTMEGELFSQLDLRFEKPVVVLKK
jgi:hypothetical protein